MCSSTAEQSAGNSPQVRLVLTEAQLREIVEVVIEGWGLDVAQAVYIRLKPYVRKDRRPGQGVGA